jgi:hypothetical protein
MTYDGIAIFLPIPYAELTGSKFAERVELDNLVLGIQLTDGYKFYDL